jgi:hypothetical protein
VTRTDPVRRFLPLCALCALAFLAGQTGIPAEDGGEIVTVARLGGIDHPPGMPLLALLARTFWIPFGEAGPRVLFSLTAGCTMWLLSRRYGLQGLVMACGILLMPPSTERMLAWDAYSPLLLVYAAALSSRRTSSLQAGYLTGLAMGLHPAGVFLPAVIRVREWRPLEAVAGLTLSLGLYLALPLLSRAGAVVDWGSCRTVGAFLRQVTAGGYREVYGTSMGRFSASVLLRHLSGLWRILWPVMILPVALGSVRLFRERRFRLLRTALLLLAADMLFVWAVNPMASGTSQTGILSLLAIMLLAFAGLFALEARPGAAWAIALAVLAAGVLTREPLPDQEGEVYGLFGRAPFRSGWFLSDNDLLYGGWTMKYVRDLRPDVVLLSTGNFTGWFEDMAVHFDPGLDLSRGVDDVGGTGLGREELTGRLIRATVEDNPDRQFYGDW